ncbi:MAG: SDR family NAD(P)-dependent oxidoreductase [Victivallales bacterium]|nr:SDR family NAD(P)-dependent oxidoreductase [Victivallales bacterium]
MAYSHLSGMFSLVWDEAETVELPKALAELVANSSNVTWPHTFITPKYASMAEYKQYSPANHFHMTWNLEVSRLQYWMDLANVISVAPWQNRPATVEGDRPTPLLYLINGRENETKRLRKNRYIMEREKIVNIAAPALRALFADENFPAVVSFLEAETDGLKVELPGDSTEEIINTLKKAVANVNGKNITVVIKNVGSFKVSVPENRGGRVGGKVAVVTGAAQGFGLEIASGLAVNGAQVVLADINATGVESAAAALNDRLGRNAAVGVVMNVTDDASIKAALSQVVKTYGGLDIFISNAGVLRAGSVKELSEKDFDFVTAVNYKGYFLCVRNVAPILAVQKLAKPDYMSDIIQINSKSGLAGSNRNGAYAGSKFGGIGLTQSFALELIADGIKVNAVCPGNFYDGPLWSDPENGLFVQYLRTGKVPGAATVADVKKFYEAKSPIHRGCTANDVLQAILYAVDQKYETGQAIPVTGGQTMLS